MAPFVEFNYCVIIIELQHQSNYFLSLKVVKINFLSLSSSLLFDGHLQVVAVLPGLIATARNDSSN